MYYMIIDMIRAKVWSEKKVRKVLGIANLVRK